MGSIAQFVRSNIPMIKYKVSILAVPYSSFGPSHITPSTLLWISSQEYTILRVYEQLF